MSSDFFQIKVETFILLHKFFIPLMETHDLVVFSCLSTLHVHEILFESFNLLFLLIKILSHRPIMVNNLLLKISMLFKSFLDGFIKRYAVLASYCLNSVLLFGELFF